jgi:hypothetical protein
VTRRTAGGATFGHHLIVGIGSHNRMTKMISTENDTSDVKALSDTELNEVAGGYDWSAFFNNLGMYLITKSVENVLRIQHRDHNIAVAIGKIVGGK